MKVALCLHGLFNSATDQSSNGLDGFDYIKKSILDHHQVDVYLHSWDLQNKERILNLYRPKSYLFHPLLDLRFWEDRFSYLSNKPRPISNVIHHFAGIESVFKLLEVSGNKYDCVIKSRFDLGRINRNTSGPGRQNHYPVQCINLLNKIEPDKVYMANWNHLHMGPADMWFYGDQDIMRNFTDIYWAYLNQLTSNSEFSRFATSIEGNPGDISNSIAFLKYWMIKNGMWQKKVLLDTVWE